VAGGFAEFIHQHITSKLMANSGGGLWILDNSINELSQVDLAAIQRLM